MKKKKKIFNMGDRVIHKFRGLGTFECYAPIADAFVKFDKGGQGGGGERITAAFLSPAPDDTKLTPANESISTER